MFNVLGRSLVSQLRRLHTVQIINKNNVMPQIAQQNHSVLQQEPTEPRLIVHSSNDALSDHSKPVSLVFGFGEAQPKHVEKYIDIYREINFPCLSYTGIGWYEHAPEPEEGAVFAPLFEDPTLKDRKLIIHSLSMNGFLSLAKLYRWMEKENVSSARIAGIIFDSSPSVPRHVGSPMEVRYSKREHNGIPNNWNKSLVAQKNSESVSNLLLFHYVLENIRLPHHQHYIYSTADKIIDYTHVEEFIKAQINKGCHVTKTRYENVAHVRHLNADYASYKEQVAGLIKRSLQSSESKL